MKARYFMSTAWMWNILQEIHVVMILGDDENIKRCSPLKGFRSLETWS